MGKSSIFLCMTTVRCPNCDATYNVDPAKLAGGGRKLKCAKCQTVWLAMAEPVEVAAPKAVEPPAAPDEAAETAAVPEVADAAADVADGDAAFAPDTDEMLVQRTPGVDAVVRVGGWRQWIRGENKWRSAALGVVILGLLGGGLVVVMKMGGEEVEEELPVVAVAAEPVAAMPSDVVQPPAGVVLHRVQGEVSEVDGQGGGVALTVRGLLANTTSQTITVPPMRLELLGKDGSVADMWPVSGIAARMEAGAEEAWTVSLTAPDMTSIQGWRIVFVAE